MNWSFRLFTIRGIDVRVHVTFVLILLWAAYYWSTVVDDGARGVVFGIVATILLFACVTLHELGHSVQAQAYDIHVQDITLLPIGGLARLDNIPEDPRKEFRIAIAGPLVNVVIAAVLAVVSVFVDTSSLTSPERMIDDLQAGTWRAMLSYLLFANILLVLFNLIPAFPMDGGRILRSLLAMRMPHVQATRIAGGIGQAMALLLGFLGFASGNFFLILIAIFVWFGAGQESAQAEVRHALSGATVSQVMSASPITLMPSDPLLRAVQLTLSSSQSDFPVIDREDYVVGLLTIDALLKAMHESPGVVVGEVMKRDFAVARPDEDVVVVQERLAAERQRAMVVIADNGRLLGLLTANDIAEAFRLFSAQPQLAGRLSGGVSR
jgi:Zn-dependent protease/predicted transcriptional regulator